MSWCQADPTLPQHLVWDELMSSWPNVAQHLIWDEPMSSWPKRCPTSHLRWADVKLTQRCPNISSEMSRCQADPTLPNISSEMSRCQADPTLPQHIIWDEPMSSWPNVAPTSRLRWADVKLTQRCPNISSEMSRCQADPTLPQHLVWDEPMSSWPNVAQHLIWDEPMSSCPNVAPTSPFATWILQGHEPLECCPIFMTKHSSKLPIFSTQECLTPERAATCEEYIAVVNRKTIHCAGGKTAASWFWHVELTHCPLGGVAEFNCVNFKHKFNRYLEHSSKHYPGMNARESQCWVNIGSGTGHGLVSSDNKPIPEPALTKISDVIWCHWATLS